MLTSSTFHVADREILRVGIGGARWSIEDPEDDRAAERVLHLAVESGIQYVDTARAYTRRESESHNERLIRRVLDHGKAWDDVLVASKGGHFRAGDRYPIDASPAALVRDCERSLRALGRDRIDLYYLHHPDPLVPFEDSVGALAALRGRGLIGAIGLCNVDLDQLAVAASVTRIDAVQNRLSVFEPIDTALIAWCRSNEVAFFGYSPLGGGRRAIPSAASAPSAWTAAADRGLPVTSVLLAWLLSLAPNVGLVTGARRPQSLAASIAAASVALTERERDGVARELERTEWPNDR